MEVYKQTEMKAKLKIGSMTMYIDKRLNWFQRLMWRTLLGIKVTNIKED